MPAQPDEIIREIRIAARPEEVFPYFTPPHRIRFSWHWHNGSSGSHPAAEGSSVSEVEVTLAPDGDGTLLRLVHRGFAGPDRDASAAGWVHYLARLQLAAAGCDPGPDPWAGSRSASSPTEITGSVRPPP